MRGRRRRILAEELGSLQHALRDVVLRNAARNASRFRLLDQIVAVHVRVPYVAEQRIGKLHVVHVAELGTTLSEVVLLVRFDDGVAVNFLLGLHACFSPRRKTNRELAAIALNLR